MKRGTSHLGIAAECICVALLLATAAGPACGGSLDPVLVGQWPGYLRGPAMAVAVSGNYAYVAQGGSGLQVIDISNPANPTSVGGCDTSGGANGVVVSGNYAYVADGDAGVQVVDVRDPGKPVRVGGYGTSGYALGVGVSGSYLYVAGGDSGMQVINVSDPANPIRVGGYDTPGDAHGVAVSGNYAYVADGGSGLLVLNVSNPASPYRSGSCDTPGYASEVALSGNYAYVADGERGLQVINVSNPTTPSLLGTYDTPGNAYGVVVSGNRAFVADGVSGLQVINVGNPASPAQASSDTSGSARGVAVSGNYIYVVGEDAGLWVINVSNTAIPVIEGRADNSGYANGLAISGKYACVADGGAGLQVIDVSDPVNPRRAGRFQTNGLVQTVALSDNYAYTAGYRWDTTNGYRPCLQIIDISAPAAPKFVGDFQTEGYAAQDVGVSGDNAYVLVNGWDDDLQRDVASLQVVDVSIPSNPFRVGKYETEGNVRDMVVNGNYAYLACYRYDSWIGAAVSGLQVINIGNPTNPQRVGTWENTTSTASDSMGIALSGSYAFIAVGAYGLQVLDISNPANPLFVGSFRSDVYVNGVSVAGNYAVLVNGDTGLQVIDISDPHHPERVAGCAGSGYASAVVASGNRLYLAEGRRGLAVFEMNVPYLLSYPSPLTELSGTVQILAQRTDGGELPSTVHYRTTGGTAAPWADYIPVLGTLEFPRGGSSVAISLTVLDDSLAEGTETIGLELIDSSNKTTNQFLLKLVDNEIPVQLDGRFSWSGRNEDIAFMDRYPDGRFLLMLYGYYGGAQRVLRLTADGVEDPGFRAPSFQALVALPDGGALCSSNSTQMIRLGPDGAVDAGFQSPVLTTNGSVSVATLKPDGRCVVGVYQYNGTTWTTRLIGLATNGSIDVSFTPAQFSAGANSSWIQRPIIQADGRILVYGSFTSVNGTARPMLARLNVDGTLDNGFAPMLNPLSLSGAPWISSVSVSPDGRIWVCGGFNGLAEMSRPGLLRLNADGTLDPAFNALLSATNGLPSAVIALADGGVLFAGENMRLGDRFVDRLARLSPDGSLLSTFSDVPIEGIVGQLWLDSPQMAVVQVTEWDPYNGSPRASLRRIFLESTGLVSTRFIPQQGLLAEPVGTLELTIERLGDTASSLPLTITVGGQAQAGLDFTIPATVTFPPLQTRQNIRLQVLDDGKLEGSELALISLTSSVSNFISGTPFRLRVEDNEEPLALDLAAPELNPGWYDITAVASSPDGGAFLLADTGIWRILSDGRLDGEFSNPQVDGPSINALAVTSEGKILVGGSFSRVGAHEAPGLARLNANGSVDASFVPDPAFGSGILRVQPNGTILIAFDGGIERRLPSGKKDPAWTGGGVATGTYVQAMELLPDGGVIALTNSSLVRLLPDGKVDTSFHSPAVQDPALGGSWVNAMAVDHQGRILIGGQFSLVDGVPRSWLARLTSNGDVDRTFTGPDSIRGGQSWGGVNAIVCEPTGEVLITGAFTEVDGVSHPYIAWLDAAGHPLHFAGPRQVTPARGGHGSVRSPEHLALQPGGKVWVWPILGVEGVPVPRIARLFPPSMTGARLEVASVMVPENARSAMVRVHRLGDISGSLSAWLQTRSETATAGSDFGSVDSSIQFAPMETTKTVEIPIFDDLLPEPDEVFLVQLANAGSGLEIVGGERPLVILDNDRRGSVDWSFSAPFRAADGWSSTSISRLGEQSGNRLLVNGDLYLDSPQSWRQLARLLADGTVDPTFTPARSGYGLRVLPDDRLMVWGDNSWFLARLLPDGALDSSFQVNLPEWTNRWVDDLVVQPDGKVLVSGLDSGFHFIRRLLSGGSLDISFPEIRLENNQWSRLLRLRDGRVLLCGNFTSIAGTARSGLAALKADGTFDPSFAPSLGAAPWVGSPGVYSAAETPDGKIVVGGALCVTNGAGVVWSVARFLPDGRVDPAFVGGQGAMDSAGNPTSVNTVAMLVDGSLVVSGDFPTFHGQRRSKLAFLRPDGTLDPSADAGLDFRLLNTWGYPEPGQILCLQPLHDGRIAVGGYFSRVVSMAGMGEVEAPGLIMLKGPVAVRFQAVEVLGDGTFRFSLQAEPGAAYVLESSDNLRQWTPVLTNRAYEHLLVFDDLGAPWTARRFFRAVQQSQGSAPGAPLLEGQSFIDSRTTGEASAQYVPSTMNQPRQLSKQSTSTWQKSIPQGSMLFNVPGAASSRAIQFERRTAQGTRVSHPLPASIGQPAPGRPGGAGGVAAREPRRQGVPSVPYVPTPQAVVDRMLKMAEIQPGDLIYDLGCGDGRILIAAAKQYGVRAVGVEIDPAMVQVARKNVEDNGLADLVRIVEGDLFSVDLSEATVVMLYLLPEMNERLKPQLRRLQPGARVVSHDSGLQGMRSAGVERMVARGEHGEIEPHTIFKWRLPFEERLAPGRPAVVGPTTR